MSVSLIVVATTQDKKAAVVATVTSCLDMITTYCTPISELIDDVAPCLDPKNVSKWCDRADHLRYAVDRSLLLDL